MSKNVQKSEKMSLFDVFDPPKWPFWGSKTTTALQAVGRPILTPQKWPLLTKKWSWPGFIRKISGEKTTFLTLLTILDENGHFWLKMVKKSGTPKIVKKWTPFLTFLDTFLGPPFLTKSDQKGVTKNVGSGDRKGQKSDGGKLFWGGKKMNVACDWAARRRAPGRAFLFLSLYTFSLPFSFVVFFAGKKTQKKGEGKSEKM